MSDFKDLSPIGKVFYAFAMLIVILIFLDAAYHVFVYIPQEYEEYENQPGLLKLAPEWIRWLVHDISKLL